MTKDLTRGKPFRLILAFMIPVLLGNILQQLFGMADTIIVGRAISSDALTGVGSTGAIVFVVLGFANGLTSGFGVRTSQYFGAGDQKNLRRSVAASLELSMILAVLLTAIALPFTRLILIGMQTPEKYFDYAYYYLLVYFGGMGSIILYNACAATLRAVGDTKTSLFFLILSAVLNIGLNIVFVVFFRLYYTGVAWATVMSQFLSGAASLLYMFRKYPSLRPQKKEWKEAIFLFKGHIKIGLPMAFQFSITGIGTIVQQSALNTLNSDMPGVATAYAAASRISGLLVSPLEALAVVSAAFAGQNFGAQKYSRIRTGVKMGLIISAGMEVIALVLVAIFSRPLTKMFFNGEGDIALYYEEIMHYSKQYLLTYSVFFIPLGVVDVVRNALQGMGYSFITLFAGFAELIGRTLSSLLFVKFWNFWGICFSSPSAWMIAGTLLLFMYLKVMKKYRGKDASLHVEKEALLATTSEKK